MIINSPKINIFFLFLIILSFTSLTSTAQNLSEAERLNSIANTYYNQGEYEKAIIYCEQALDIREKLLGYEHPDVAASLNTLAELYRVIGRYAEAEPLFKRSLAIREKSLGPDDPNVGTSLNNLAALFYTQGRYAEAEALFKRSLSIYEKSFGPDHPNVAQILNNLVLLYQSQGRYAEAEPLCKRSLAIREKSLGPVHPDVAESLNSLAGLYYTQCRYAEAEPLYKRSLSIREKSLGPDHPYVGISLNNIAQLYYSQSRYTEAEPLYKRSLAILEKSLGPDHPNVGQSLNNLAMLYKIQGRYVEAEPLVKRSLAINEKSLGPDHTNVGTILNNLANLYDTQGRYAEAEPLYKRSLSIREKSLGPDHPDVAQSLSNLAALYHRQGRYAEAEPLFKRSLSIREKSLGSDHPDLALSLNNLAKLYETQGRYEEAEPLYKRSLSIWEKSLGPDNPYVALNLNNLAGLEGVMGRYQDALAHMDMGLEIDEKVIDNVFSGASERVKFAFLKSLNYRYNMLFSLVYQGLLEENKALIACLNSALKRKGMVLEALSGERTALLFSDYSEAKDILKKDQSLSTQLSNLIFSGPGNDDPSFYKQKIADLEKTKEEIESKLASMSQAYAQEKALRKVDYLQVCQKLPVDAGLIEIVKYRNFDFKTKDNQKRWGDKNYLAFILKKSENPTPILIDLGKADMIDEVVRTFRQKMFLSSKNISQMGELKAEEILSEKAKELYQLVFLPISKYLDGTKTLYFSPDGELNLVPFGLFEDENGRYLMEKYQIHYLSSGRDLVRFQEQAKGKQKIVIIADPDFNMSGDKRVAASQKEIANDLYVALRSVIKRSPDLKQVAFESLPETRKEAGLIEQLFDKQDVESYLGPNALEEVFKGLKAPKTLHIATHGFFLEEQDKSEMYNEMDRQRGFKVMGEMDQFSGLQIENPLLRSGLVLAGANRLGSEELPEGVDDGILTALEIAGKNFMGTDLVVLSACETGLGETMPGEGVFGLRRAFQLAGARSVVMSLWKVPDKETRELMVEFYKRIQTGEGKSSALQNAQLEMMKKRKKETGAAHPFFWGAFVCVGD